MYTAQINFEKSTALAEDFERGSWLVLDMDRGGPVYIKLQPNRIYVCIIGVEILLFLWYNCVTKFERLDMERTNSSESTMAVSGDSDRSDALSDLVAENNVRYTADILPFNRRLFMIHDISREALFQLCEGMNSSAKCCKIGLYSMVIEESDVLEFSERLESCDAVQINRINWVETTAQAKERLGISR